MRGLIFDFDGLILDTELPAFQTWQEVYQAHGCSLPLSTYATCIGSSGLFDPHEHLETQLGRSLDREAIRSQRRQRYIEMTEGQSTLPGVRGYVTDAKRLGLKLGVASSSPMNGLLAISQSLDSGNTLIVSSALTTSPAPSLTPSYMSWFSMGSILALIRP